YYAQNELQAVFTGDGRWKLQLPHTFRSLAGRPGGTNGIPAKYQNTPIVQAELYDLSTDIGEKVNLASSNPAIVERLLAEAENARAELGDSLTQRGGSGVREPGRLADSK
ncbi:MAG: arylsulfatase, partial [Verrucomicrobia bacterium]|nr:arylsulfatase [Verrucomicrobiota bacterium]